MDFGIVFKRLDRVLNIFVEICLIVILLIVNMFVVILILFLGLFDDVSFE